MAPRAPSADLELYLEGERVLRSVLRTCGLSQGSIIGRRAVGALRDMRMAFDTVEGVADRLAGELRDLQDKQDGVTTERIF
jgi:hypothetical protein